MPEQAENRAKDPLGYGQILGRVFRTRSAEAAATHPSAEARKPRQKKWRERA
jgi:hypothetical protein